MKKQTIKITLTVMLLTEMYGVALAGPPYAAHVPPSTTETKLPPMPQKTSETGDIPKTFYEDAKHGWWWYEIDPDKKEEDDKQAKKVFVPVLKDYPMEQLMTMYPDDFQALITAFQKKAVQNPTEESVHEFYTMVDITRRRAQAFTNVAEVVWQKNPDLMVTKDYPSNVLGVHTQTIMKKAEVDNKILFSSSNFALVYFYSESCEYCQAESGVLKYFLDKYKWNIKTIEINQRPDFAQKFNVETVPLILMVYKETGESIPVSVGVVPLDELEHNIYRGIRLLSGEINSQEFNMYDYERGGGFDTSAMPKQ